MVTAAMSYSLSTGNKQIENNFFDDIQKMVAGDGIVSIKRDRQSGQIIDSYSAKKGQITGEIKVDLSDYDEKHVNKTDVYIYDYNERNNLNNKNITNASIKNYLPEVYYEKDFCYLVIGFRLYVYCGWWHSQCGAQAYGQG